MHVRSIVQKTYEGIDEWNGDLEEALEALELSYKWLQKEYQVITDKMRDVKRCIDVLNAFKANFRDLARFDNEVGLSVLNDLPNRRTAE